MKFLVGLMVGGLMEDPKLRIKEPFYIIEADDEEKARQKYNKHENCSFYYGSIAGTLIDNTWKPSRFISENDLQIALNKAKTI